MMVCEWFWSEGSNVPGQLLKNRCMSRLNYIAACVHRSSYLWKVMSLGNVTKHTEILTILRMMLNNLKLWVSDRSFV